jgi:DNA polymerase
MAVRTQGGVTQIRKPNSTKLTYHSMRLHDGSLVFSGVWKGKKWLDSLSTYGGHLTENIVQSVARDIMAEAMLRAEVMLSEVPVLTVHDQIDWEVQGADENMPMSLHQCANVVPSWAKGLPIASELHVGVRYPK